MVEDRKYIYAERRIAERRIALYVVHRRLDGQSLVGRIEWEPHPEFASPYPCTETLDDMAAQVLMDQLWEAGLRPTEAAGSAGAMAAAQANLADLRQMITFLQDLTVRGPSPLELVANQFAAMQKLNDAMFKQLAASTNTIFPKEPKPE